MKKARRAVAKAPARPKTKTPARRLVLKTAPVEAMTPEEVGHLETLVKRFEDSEKAWQRMTAPVEEGDPWAKVEDHLLERAGQDSDRRWKFFSK